jgi:hypothetical protein
MICYAQYMDTIYKFPRTRHLRGSGLQKGDEDLELVSAKELVGKFLVIEEKVDGANSGISFDSETLEMKLQSRGHFLTGGPRERHFNLFKTWAATHSERFLEVLLDRYVMYGEWMYAKHTEFYDLLPHYWLEFDILDKQRGVFLSTHERDVLAGGLPIRPVPVLFKGRFDNAEHLEAWLRDLIKPSLYKSPNWKQKLREVALAEGLDPERAMAETDQSDLAEGLYIKWEDDGIVKDRYKFVRGEFVQQILDSEIHWLSRPIVPNKLAPGVDIFGGGHG